MHFTNYGKIERGIANPSLVTLVRIAVALEIDPAKLVQGLGADNLKTVTHQVTASDVILARRMQGKQRGAYKRGSLNPDSHGSDSPE